MAALTMLWSAALAERAAAPNWPPNWRPVRSANINRNRSMFDARQFLSILEPFSDDERISPFKPKDAAHAKGGLDAAHTKQTKGTVKQPGRSLAS